MDLTSGSLWIAGRRYSALFGVVDDTTTTKFTGRACAVHCNLLPVVVDKVVVVVLKFPNDVMKTPAASPSVTTESNSSPESKLTNIKILESLFSKKPREADEYFGYLKFLAIKGTRFQTKAILAFDQD